MKTLTAHLESLVQENGKLQSRIALMVQSIRLSQEKVVQVSSTPAKPVRLQGTDPGTFYSTDGDCILMSTSVASVVFSITNGLQMSARQHALSNEKAFACIIQAFRCLPCAVMLAAYISLKAEISIKLSQTAAVLCLVNGLEQQSSCQHSNGFSFSA